MATYSDGPTASSTSAGSTLPVTGVTAAVGALVTLFCSADNAGASGASSTSSTVTDPAGNTWNLLAQTTQTAGATDDGTTLSMWSCLVTSALVAATITLNFSPNTTSKAAAVQYGVPAAGCTMAVGAVGPGVTNAASTSRTSGAVSVTLGTTMIGASAVETNSAFTADGDTVNGSWSTQLTASANSGAFGTSQTISVQRKTVTATGNQTYNTASGAARDSALNYLLVYEQFNGTGAATLGALTGAATGTLALAGTASATLGAMTGSAVGISGIVTALIPNVIYLTGYPGPSGSLDIPILTQFAIDAGVGVVDIQSSRGLAILLRASLVDPDGVVSIQGPPYPAGFLDVPTGFQIDFSGSLETIYPAASLGRSSVPDDTPGNLYVPGKLMPLNFGIKLFDGIEPAPRGTGGFGAIILPDPDGELDDLVNLAWDGAALDILRGAPLARYDTYAVVGRMSTAGLLYDQRKKEVRLRDLGDQLTKAELHGYRYGGSGGADGDAAIAGTVKPYGVGTVANTEPVPVNAVLLLYALSCSSIAGVDEVRDGGVPLAFDADYADYATLAGATVPAGNFATCLAEGFIRLGSKPVFIITVDFRGDADTILGHATPTTMGTIARRVACGRGTIRLTEAQIDSVSFGAFESERTAAVGFYWREAISKADALDEIMAGTLGWWAVRLNGKLAIGYMREPTDSPALTIDYPEDFGGEPSQLNTYLAPRRATYVTWERNYTTQDASRLAASVASADALIWGQPARLASSVSGFTPSVWPTSAAVAVPGAYRDESDALAEASRQQVLMGVRRERWSIPVPCDPFADLLGRVVQVNDFPRYGWGAARKFICVGMSFASSRSVLLDLWG